MPRFLSRVGILGAASATQPLVVGTGSPIVGQGLGWGTDGPEITRSASNAAALSVNQLDQAVLPVTTFLLHQDSSLVVAASTTATPTIGTFTMPFYGDIALAGSGMFTTVVNGTVPVPQARLVSNTGTLDKNPDNWWRPAGAGGNGDYSTIPIFARYTNLPANATVTITLSAGNAGTASMQIIRMTCMVTAIRKIAP